MENWITVKDAEKLSGMTESKFKHYLYEGNYFKHKKENGHRLINKESLEEFLKSNVTKARKPYTKKKIISMPAEADLNTQAVTSGQHTSQAVVAIALVKVSNIKAFLRELN